MSGTAARLARETQIAAAHGDTVSRNYLSDARQLARSAERFCNDVETQAVSNAKVNAQFRRVAGAFRRFQEQVNHANSRQALPT